MYCFILFLCPFLYLFPYGLYIVWLKFSLSFYFLIPVLLLPLRINFCFILIVGPAHYKHCFLVDPSIFRWTWFLSHYITIIMIRISKWIFITIHCIVILFTSITLLILCSVEKWNHGETNWIELSITHFQVPTTTMTCDHSSRNSTSFRNAHCIIFHPVRETTLIICEKYDTALTCHTGTLHILDANYGRTHDGAVCPHSSSTYITNCYLDESLETVRGVCEGLSTCTVQATNTFFGQDPCPTYYKYLNISYTCQ